MVLAYSALDLSAFPLLGESGGQTLFKYDLKEHCGKSPLKHQYIQTVEMFNKVLIALPLKNEYLKKNQRLKQINKKNPNYPISN